MAMTPRFAWQNFGNLSNTVVTTSSEDPSFPKRWLRDPLRTMAWRSKIGWNIVSGFNDTIDLDINGYGPVSATVTSGSYTTGADLAVAVQAALIVAYGIGTWTVSYSTSLFTFTIGHSTKSFELLPVSGASGYKTIVTDLGFSADTGYATSHEGSAVYQARSYIKFDLGSAFGVDAVFLAGMLPMTSGSHAHIQANSTDTWSSPAYDVTISGSNQNVDMLAHWIETAQSYRFWRIIIDDPYSSGGFVKAGVAYVGSYLQLGRGPAFGQVSDSQLRFSKVQVGDTGGIFVDVKGVARAREWTFNLVSDTEKSNLETMQSQIDLRPQFFAIDPVGRPTYAEYGLVTFDKFEHVYGGGSSTAFWNVVLKTQEQIQ